MSFSHVLVRLTRIFILLVISTLIVNSTVMGQSVVTLENDNFKYVIGLDGKNQSFIDKRTETDYCKRDTASYCAGINKNNKDIEVSSVTYDGTILTMEFDEANVRAKVKITVNKHSMIWEVVSVDGTGVESFNFINFPLVLSGLPNDPFAVCVLSLNLRTRVKHLPALQTHLWAECYECFGMEGAKIALIGVPQADILPVIRDIMSNQDEIPLSTAGGAWAQISQSGRGSYLMNFGTLTTETVDEWIDMVKSLGFNQIDNHGGSRFFRFGDFVLKPDKWPNGWDDFKAINKRLHDEGIESIFHPYAFFIDTDSKYVTPVPHPGLGAFRSFTLVEPITEDAEEITVVESTEDISLTTGFFVRNSVTLHIGDELITFSDVTRELPYKFLGCTRGVHDTKASSHAKRAKARHLKQMFGRFAPDPNSDLFIEIASRIAEIVNYCEFDGIYFDAIDGSDILGGMENFWYYGTKFIIEIANRLERPVGMEMSSMRHLWWHFRSRWQAWDRPTRGYKRFTDIHIAAIKTDCYEHGLWQGHKPLIDKYAPLVNGGLLLPLHLGWWGNQTWNPPQVEPTFPDDIEYLCCKMIGNDAGLSMLGGGDKKTLKESPAIKRLVDIIKQYETLRHEKYFDESVRKELRKPGKEFMLIRDDNYRWNFRQAMYDKHKVENVNHWSSTWQVNNPFERQLVKVRIEALMSAGSYDSPDNIIIGNFSNENDFQEKQTANGVMTGLHSFSENVKAGKTSGKFSAYNSGEVNQDAAWVVAEKSFEPTIDLSEHQALGVWIYGDGQGELINIRLQSPLHIAHGARGDHFIMVDFTGWRYFELIEIESSRFSDYVWPGSYFFVYDSYRHSVRFNAIDRLSIWYNNLPANKKVTCLLSPIKALPMVSSTIKNPKVTVNGETLVFPVEMKSGDYIEFYSMDDCKLYDPKGNLIKNVTPIGKIPLLTKGINRITFDSDGLRDISCRANVTVISYGETL